MQTSGEFFLPRPWLVWFSLPRSWVFPLLLGDQFLSAACHLVQYVFVEPRNGWIDRWKDEIKSRRHQSTPDGRGPKWAAQTERTAVPCPLLLAASQTPWPPRCSSNLSANGSLGPSCNWPLLATQVSDHPVQSSPPPRPWPWPIIPRAHARSMSRLKQNLASWLLVFGSEIERPLRRQLMPAKHVSCTPTFVVVVAVVVCLRMSLTHVHSNKSAFPSRLTPLAGTIGCCAKPGLARMTQPLGNTKAGFVFSC